MTPAPPEIRTARTLLRRLHPDDLPIFAEMNADPAVMRYFPRPWTLEESRRTWERIDADLQARGFGVYALEVDSAFAGIVGLSTPSFQQWFTPCVEILWRLRPGFWGRGLAPEAAAAVLKMAKEVLALQEVFAFAVSQNLPSIRVMEKIGMSPCDPPLFDHPSVEEPHLKQHILYKAWMSPIQSKTTSDPSRPGR